MIKKIREMEGIIMRGNERERVMKVKYPPPPKKATYLALCGMSAGLTSHGTYF